MNAVNPQKSPEPVSRRLAEVLARTSYPDLPAPAIEEAKRAVLDWLGSAMAGSFEPPARMARHVAEGLGRSEEAAIVGAGRASAAAAALANGVASHILEFDDVHKGSTLHAAAPVIPAALAVAQREHAGGKAFLAAVVAGYEAALRVGEAVNPSHYYFWHPTGTAATFGAAAAAGSILKLSEKQMLDALGTAGTQAAGLWEFNADGAMSKHLHPGKAAFNGILAADLARAGFTGASHILEGERGFLRAMSASHDASRIVDGLGERWKIVENCYKMHSCCAHTHTAIDTALELRRDAEITAVEIEMYGPGYEIVKEMNPRTPYQAKFSIAYCVAAALAEGTVGLAQFSPDRFDADGVRHLAIAGLIAKTRVSVSPQFTAKYPAEWTSRVCVTFAGGSMVNGSNRFPRGNPENRVSTSELEAKFVALVEPRFSREDARRAIDKIRDLENCEDISSFL
jgi:2-methylcitrate dehydratase PrpD